MGSTSHFSTSGFAKLVEDDLSSEISTKIKKTIYSDPISNKNQTVPTKIGGIPGMWSRF